MKLKWETDANRLEKNLGRPTNGTTRCRNVQ